MDTNQHELGAEETTTDCADDTDWGSEDVPANHPPSPSFGVAGAN